MNHHRDEEEEVKISKSLLHTPTTRTQQCRLPAIAEEELQQHSSTTPTTLMRRRMNHNCNNISNNNPFRIVCWSFMFMVLLWILGLYTFKIELRLPAANNNNYKNLDNHHESTTTTTTTTRPKNNNTNYNYKILKSYSYDNCPFQMAKFSQFFLAKEGPYTNRDDERLNSLERAKMALDLSNDYKAFDRVSHALVRGAFDNRTVVLDGDSLTRQFFISLSCMAWSAGYVTDYALEPWTTSGDRISILKNAGYRASTKNFGMAHVALKGGGKIHYISNPGHIEPIAQRLKHMASCSQDKPPETTYGARFSWDMNNLLPLKKDDVHILAAGHVGERLAYIAAYKEFFQCMKEKKKDNATNNTSDFFEQWPHFFYQLSGVESFWTSTGMYGAEPMPGKDPMTCQPSVPFAPHREQEQNELGGLVPFLAEMKDVNVKHLGEYHVEHGDCLHWILPGVPDLYAADLADFLMAD